MSETTRAGKETARKETIGEEIGKLIDDFYDALRKTTDFIQRATDLPDRAERELRDAVKPKGGKKAPAKRRSVRPSDFRL
jgi:hypothetical protein